MMTQAPKKPTATRKLRIAKSIGMVAAKAAAAELRKRAGRTTQGSVKAIVAAQMPGWKVALDTQLMTDPMEDSDMKSERGPSIAQLRHKFLGDDAADQVADSADIFGKGDDDRRTVRIEPKRGGSAKTADIKNGKISIVQG